MSILVRVVLKLREWLSLEMEFSKMESSKRTTKEKKNNEVSEPGP